MASEFDAFLINVEALALPRLQDSATLLVGGVSTVVQVVAELGDSGQDNMQGGYVEQSMARFLLMAADYPETALPATITYNGKTYGIESEVSRDASSVWVLARAKDKVEASARRLRGE